ncbi:MAG: lamin tail domain-containing protein [Sandaracinus sp.]|nr:lamin tail domain-containing protein [Sandaracinus sp.]MCB9618017.1 lamin tail domain-containing protein [Sandaracinus sp.]MCB9622248.1 lamin tail domain-containing protein [Sandaracinus sp.]
MKRTQWLIVLAALAIGVGCGDDDVMTPDSGMGDAGRDAGRDSGTVDGGSDAGTDGGGMDDAGMDDAGMDDGGTDAGMEDGGTDGGTDGGMTASGIDAVRAATPGTLDPAITVADATLTYTRPMLGSDPAGFFVQSAAAGPALFVAIDPSTLTPALAVGDTVTFNVTTTATVGGMLHVTAIDTLSRSATGADVSTLMQDVTAATDLVSATGDYESEYVFANVTLAGADTFSGTGHRAFPVDTTGLTGDTSLQLRVPDAFIANLALEPGCVVAVGPSPLWRFANATTNRAQFMGYRESDLVVSSCPLPQVTGAVATSATTVVVSFSRPLDPATVMPEDFAFTGGAGLTASAVTVAADGRSATVTVGAMTNGTTYTVTVTGVEDAITADGIDTAANTAMFEALGPEVGPMVGEVIISEITYNAVGSGADEWIELHNVGSVDRQLLGCILNGGGASDIVTFGNVVIAAGDYLVVGGATSEASPDVTWTTFGLGNGGEALTLTCAATVIDTVTYASGGMWPPSTDGVSVQLSNDLLDATSNDAGGSWCLTASDVTYGPDTTRRGTPGAANADCTPPEPAVVSAAATSATEVTIVFSMALDAGTVAVGDFAFSDGLTASAVTLSGDGLTATVTTSMQTAGTTYTVTVTGVTNTTGTAIGAMNMAMFNGFMVGGVVPTPGDLVISEIMQNPTATADGQGEYVEFYNASGNTLDLNGLVLRDDGADSHTIDAGGPLLVAPGAYIVLGINAMMATNGGVPVAYQYASFTLANGDDEVVLATAGGTEIVRAAYDGGPMWPDPAGASMQLNPTMLTSAASNMAAAWCTSTVAISGTNPDLGTPGAANSVCP